VEIHADHLAPGDRPVELAFYPVGDSMVELIAGTTPDSKQAKLIAEGKANKEIASDLGIGIKTVEKHREHLMRKLDLHDTAGVTRYAISAGIIESSVQITIV
jgi:DNA-binding CsgD family transcriptional regulator